MHHPTSIHFEGGMEELVKTISNLRYDALAEFMRMLAVKIRKDSEADKERGREKLAAALQESANSMDRAWTICKPFMPNA